MNVGSLIRSGKCNPFSSQTPDFGAEEPNIGANLIFKKDTFQS
jgi:hypothetical protein